MKVNSGQDLQAAALTGGAFGTSGTATSTTVTSLTNTGASFTTTGNGLKGQVVVAGSSYGVILSNTATALTVDQWNSPAAPGTVGTTPGGTATYVVMPGNAFVQFMAITNTGSFTPAATDTSLSGEQTTNGLGRKVATYAHTSGTSSYTLSATYTYTGSTAVTITGIGTFNTVVASSGIMLHESAITAATVNANGDQVTITQTVNM